MARIQASDIGNPAAVAHMRVRPVALRRCLSVSFALLKRERTPILCPFVTHHSNTTRSRWIVHLGSVAHFSTDPKLFSPSDHFCHLIRPLGHP